MLVDSHVNLHSDKYEGEVESIIDAARCAGVEAMLTISDKLSSTPAIEQIANAHDFIWRTIGVHPHYADEHPSLSSKELVALTVDPKVVGIGECGLDFYYEHSKRGSQMPVFLAHIGAARETGLPLVIHTRDADDEMAVTLKNEYKKGAFTPLLHCYTGGQRLAETALALGGYISFSGILTFKNADDIREIAKNAPMDRIIIETDCPYLAPVPMRGRRNEPAFLVHIADQLAGIRGVDRDTIETATTDNFFRLFSRTDREGTNDRLY